MYKIVPSTFEISTPTPVVTVKAVLALMVKVSVPPSSSIVEADVGPCSVIWGVLVSAIVIVALLGLLTQSFFGSVQP